METFADYIPNSLMELVEDPEMREKIEDTARIFFSNGSVTVNLIPAILVGLGLLALKSLLGIPLLGLLGGSGGGSATGYGGASSGYGAPDAGYGAPDAGYGAPDAGYGAPSGGGAAAPSAGYNAGRKKRTASLSDEQKSLYNDVIAHNMDVAPVASFVMNHAVEQAAVVSDSLPLLD